MMNDEMISGLRTVTAVGVSGCVSFDLFCDRIRTDLFNCSVLLRGC